MKKLPPNAKVEIVVDYLVSLLDEIYDNAPALHQHLKEKYSEPLAAMVALKLAIEDLRQHLEGEGCPVDTVLGWVESIKATERARRERPEDKS